jgi:N,N-dimethylformamidase beta subunit-like protein
MFIQTSATSFIIISVFLSVIFGVSLKISSSISAPDFTAALGSDQDSFLSPRFNFDALISGVSSANLYDDEINSSSPKFVAIAHVEAQDIKNKSQDKTTPTMTSVLDQLGTNGTRVGAGEGAAAFGGGGGKEPLIKIINPVHNSTYATKEITVDGSAYSLGGADKTGATNSIVTKVEVSYHDNTKNISFPYEPAIPSTPGNWSRWSVKLDLNSAGYYRILARVTDIWGNQAWNSTTIHVPFLLTETKNTSPTQEQHNLKIALVQNTFTESAYNLGGFYAFYSKYDSTRKGLNITSDLDMLNTEIPREASKNHILTLTKHLENVIPSSTFTNIIDQDVHDGRIFSSHDRSNVYDILILFHEEYVTNEMYDNFRRFVNNGGTIVFIDANIFIAQVNYNKDKNTVTLVKGHTWDFDGKSARKSDPERWFNETKEWVGSNFVNRPISANIFFLNNPFDYTHFEDNYINNPHILTLFDYKARIPGDNVYSNDTKIAAYSLNNGNGRVVMLGIYAEKVLNNKTFLDFFDNVILPSALAQTIPTTPSIRITKPTDNSTLKQALNITVEGTTNGTTDNASTHQINARIKDVEVLLDNSTYYKARPQVPNNWSNWSMTFNFPRIGSHTIIARVTDSAGNMNWSSVKVFTESADKFGIKKIYQTEQNGREWYLNMKNPYEDKDFILGDILLEKQPDGSWKVGSSNRQDPFNGKYHIILGVNTPPHKKEWKNVEITGYAKAVSTSDAQNVLQWYARGANHTSKAPCEGTSLKGRILINGSVGWKKEIWHDGGYTDQNASFQATDSILNRWIGWKVVIYNINNDTAVKMESYLDDKNNNKWQKVTDFIDNGRWYSSSSDAIFSTGNCGKPKDYIVTNAGPVVAFRSDGIVWNFKNLSVREIQPPSPPS